MQTHILIVGGGLSGLHTAYECHKRGLDCVLLEARNRLGGRALSLNLGQSTYISTEPAFDLGPSWFWPGQQRMLSLIEELGLSTQIISQNSLGSAIFEDNQGNVQRGIDGISMAGAYRLRGGIQQLTNALKNQLEDSRVMCNAVLKDVCYADENVVCNISQSEELISVKCKYIVLAMPPRVALANIKFSPVLNEARVRQLNNIATWMAGHAKLVCVYENNFWREQGMSGDVISHRGPLQEIHDASSDNGELNALFGFVGVPPAHRKNHEEEIKGLAIAQLVRLFGEAAKNPNTIYLQDWSSEKYTATQYDQEIQRFHPANNIGYTEEIEWNKQLIWSGTEAADYKMQNNGFLEGALEASMQAISLLTAK
jgi:monoamine oxidase